MGIIFKAVLLMLCVLGSEATAHFGQGKISLFIVIHNLTLFTFFNSKDMHLLGYIASQI